MSLCIDNYIKSPEILSSKEFQDTNFWTDTTSYWLPIDFKPRTRRQRLVSELWQPIVDSQELKIAGFEYWSGVNRNNTYLQTHRDRDEKLFEDTGENVYPLVGSVYYPLIDSLEGGELVIYQKEIDSEPFEKLPPVQNRIVFFDSGHLWHKICKVTSGTRVHFAVNVWETEPYGLGKEGGMNIEEVAL